ncbi:hypothetical protein [Litchfieldia salsa]|uniref:Uncharacterized protein n=1 Tax=Litchfieldia salsa TaxID=930152 RepID=A0A1H0VAL8_9BACI|nr:hypothetical protein [Litchfieldia salsa]SDP75609.1 hypothetical protein SAMN05216565_106149 [Litchfieldia salsa]
MENYSDTATNEANIKLNKELEDTTVHTLSNDVEQTNRKLNEEFYDGSEKAAENMAPTYLYNNTPAIKINEKSK